MRPGPCSTCVQVVILELSCPDSAACENPRELQISANGIIEETFTPQSQSMQLSALIYESWRFKDEALPADLIKRCGTLSLRLRLSTQPQASEAMPQRF